MLHNEIIKKSCLKSVRCAIFLKNKVINFTGEFMSEIDIKKAREVLINLRPIPLKRIVLEELKKEIQQAIKRGNSLRAIYTLLKAAGYTGSVMTLATVVKGWGIESKKKNPKKTKTDVTVQETQETISKEFADKASSYDNDDV